jgi:hypothetical protein
VEEAVAPSFPSGRLRRIRHPCGDMVEHTHWFKG